MYLETYLVSHCSATFDKYCLSSLADLWSTLNVATEPGTRSFPFLKERERGKKKMYQYN